MKVRIFHLSFCLALVSLSFAGYAHSGAAERWRILASSDSLALHMNGQAAGTLIQSIGVNDRTQEVVIERVLKVGAVQGGAQTLAGMALSEKRAYGFDGRLRKARQTLHSSTGSSEWRLTSDRGGVWKLTTLSGKQERTQRVRPVIENLQATRELYAGMRDRTIKAGDRFLDTMFELTSGQSVTTVVRCVDTPCAANSHAWHFSCWNSASDRDEAWKLDTNRSTLYQEIFPFVAKKADRASGAAGGFSMLSLVESLAVRVSRPAGADESIRLTLDGSRTPDSTVRPYFRRRGGSWLVRSLPDRCSGRGRAEEQHAAGKPYTGATAIMQADDRRIKRIADSLCRAKRNRCDSIGACFRYVFATLEKRYVPTFSNAIETLEAGYGDCGEHSALLGALLRSVNIPARIVLGLVYVKDKGGYYYHAWVTAKGPHGWLFVDPALGKFPAAHDRIPLVIDDTGREMATIAKMVGRIKIDYVPSGKSARRAAGQGEKR
ncbi:MAG: transglutaminase domain-containing protein [Chitinispirillaceae bacterium]|nr:transglutaminase domain-containing protein [Chitinispirillaceae bacterium]